MLLTQMNMFLYQILFCVNLCGHYDVHIMLISRMLSEHLKRFIQQNFFGFRTVKDLNTHLRNSHKNVVILPITCWVIQDSITMCALRLLLIKN